MGMFWSNKHMTHIQVISKEAHKILNQVDGDNISLSRPSVVILKVDRNNVKKIEKIGHDALITLDSGEKIIINRSLAKVIIASLSGLRVQQLS